MSDGLPVRLCVAGVGEVGEVGGAAFLKGLLQELFET